MVTFLDTGGYHADGKSVHLSVARHYFAGLLPDLPRWWDDHDCLLCLLAWQGKGVVPMRYRDERGRFAKRESLWAKIVVQALFCAVVFYIFGCFAMM